MDMYIDPNYSDRAIALYGNVGPYFNDIIAMGGQHNQRLKGGPGFIFSKKKLGEVQAFLNQVQAGVQPTQPAAVTPIVVAPVAVPPLNLTPGRVFPAPVLTPGKIVTPVPATPKTSPSSLRVTDVPNVLSDEAGIDYQIMLLTVPLPKVGLKLTTNNRTVVVKEIRSSFDLIATDELGAYSVKLVGGNWTVFVNGTLEDVVALQN